MLGKPRSTVVAPLALLALVCGGSLESAPAPTREPRPDYPRAVSRGRSDDGTRPRRALPPPLRLDVPQSGARSSEENETRPPRRDSPRSPAPPAPDARIEAELVPWAVSAALYCADVAVESVGRPEYFRVGFHEGMSAALEDPRLGYDDRRGGERSGWEDDQARDVGGDLGHRAAVAAASRDAEAQVVAQFRDLSIRPNPVPRAGRPGYRPELPEVPPPTLDEVLAEYPFVDFGVIDALTLTMLEPWTRDAGRLRLPDRYSDFYDPGWDDPWASFASWIERPELSAYYHSLPDAAYRGTFEDWFAETFATRIAARFPTDLLPAFESGLTEGWSYGSFIRAEHEFRTGFRAGWLDAVEDEARATFDAVYAARYDEEYRAFFEDWSTHPKLEIVEAQLGDDNRDGIFEPGERLEVDYRLVNYGGGRARLPVELDAPVLEASARVVIDLPARSFVSSERALEARIAPSVPVRTDSALDLRVGDAVRTLPLRVSRPLQFRRADWEVERRNLDGQVDLRIALRNESLLPVAGRIELATTSSAGLRLTRDLGTVGVGETRRVALRVEGLDPLDLLAGRVALDVDVFAADGTHQDSITCHVPDAARDLRNRDLLLYVARLAGSRPADPDTLVAVRGLLVTRLREDWKVAAAGAGNPYKLDYRNGSGTTALGDLVRTYLEQDVEAREHDVFAGLSAEVLELARRLPGTHPFLRSYLRKLALELP